MEHRLIERIKRSLAGGVLVVGLVTALVLTAYTPAEAAEVRTVPSAEPGSVVRVTGTADSVGLERVRLCWDQSGCANLGTVQLGLLQTSYSTEITIPDTAGAGLHSIHACTSLSCASATIDVVVPVEPTTTTTLAVTSTTTPPPPSTTTQPPSTPIEEETTTTLGQDRGGSIGATEVTNEMAPAEVADLTISSTDEPVPEPESGEVSRVTSTTTYRPPTTRHSPPSSPPTTAPGSASLVIEVEAANDDTGATYDPRIVFWTLWLLVVIAAGGLASTVWWLAKRR